MSFSIMLNLVAAADEQPNLLQQLGPIPLFLAIFALFFFLVLRPAQKRDRLQRETLLSCLKKNDKVLTSGGIIGLIALVNEKEDEVTLKVDESSNVRIRVLKSSIVKNYTAEEAAKDMAKKDESPKNTEETAAAGKS